MIAGDEAATVFYGATRRSADEAPALARLQLQACVGRGSFGAVYVCTARELDEPDQVSPRTGRLVAPTRPAAPLGAPPRTRRPLCGRVMQPARENRAQGARRGDELWALKVIAKAQLRGEDMVEQVRMEIDVLRIACQHTFVVGFHWAEETATHFHLCMEYCPGGDLFTHISGGSLNYTNCKPIVAQIALALNFLHRNNIVYRDLKPENLMLSGTGRVRLLDFGFAVLLTDEHLNEENGRLELESSCGTLPYAAPEVLQRLKHSFEADWWSFGIVAHELMYGLLPFDEEDPQACCKQICTMPLPAVEGVPTDSVDWDFLRGLLRRNRPLRLGYRVEDFQSQILGHPFFATIDFAALDDARRPLRPLHDRMNLSNFVAEDTASSSSVPLPPPPPPPPQQQQQQQQ